ncbi:hypothetical protein M8J76_000103 [Diaphorina citri]|nr:hypothetical protein M8J75_007477 [Diaphorina citri]KAI5726293.1 hypothetical protein M8J76_000103 [Diaphorina citri]
MKKSKKSKTSSNIPVRKSKSNRPKSSNPLPTNENQKHPKDSELLPLNEEPSWNPDRNEALVKKSVHHDENRNDIVTPFDNARVSPPPQPLDELYPDVRLSSLSSSRSSPSSDDPDYQLVPSTSVAEPPSCQSPFKFAEQSCDPSPKAQNKKRVLSFSSSLVCDSKPRAQFPLNPVSSEKLPSILTNRNRSTMDVTNTSSKSEIGESTSSSSVDNSIKCLDRSYRRDDVVDMPNRVLALAPSFQDYLHTSPSDISCDSSDLDSTNLNSTGSSWILERNPASVNYSDSILQDSSELKGSFEYSPEDLDYSHEDFAKGLDDSDVKLPLSSSTPFKTQNTKPDLINVREREILRTLEYTEGKIEAISLMVDSMQTDVLQLEQMAKRKESNNKMLQESFDTMRNSIAEAEEINNSICTKTEMLDSDLFASWESAEIDDFNYNDELTHKYEEFESKLSGEENLTRDLKKELELLRKEFNTLECRVTDIEDQKELKEKIREIQEKKDKLSRVTKTINGQDKDSFSQQETEHLYNKLEEKLKYFMKIANTWEQLEGGLIHFQNHLKEEVDKLKKEMGKSAEFIQELIKQELSMIQDPEAFHKEVSRVLSEKCADPKQGCHLYRMAMPSCEGSDSGISDSEHDCERDRKLSDLRQMQKDLDSVLSSNNKTLIAKKMDETEAELRKLKNLRRLVFHSTLLPQTETETVDAETQQDTTAATSANTAPWNICRDRKNHTKIIAGAAGGPAVAAETSATTDDPDDSEPPYKSNSQLWRIVRSALPFHLAIIVIACMVWLFEPNCCDHLNNLNLSRTPQLKYISGPPPI